jgi:hypothetical protein
MAGTSPAMTSSECCSYAFTVGFIAQAVLAVAIFEVA